MFLDVKQPNHDLLARLEAVDELVEQANEEFAVEVRVSGEIAAERGSDHFRFLFREVRVGDERAGAGFAQPVVACVDREARGPVLERLGAAVLVDFEENFHKNFLCDIVVVSRAADVAADGGLEERVEAVDQLIAGVLVAAFKLFKQLLADF